MIRQDILGQSVAVEDVLEQSVRDLKGIGKRTKREKLAAFRESIVHHKGGHVTLRHQQVGYIIHHDVRPWPGWCWLRH